MRPILLLGVAGAILGLAVVLLAGALRGRARPTGARTGQQGQSAAEADAIRERNAETIFLRAKDAVANSRWQAAEEHLTLLAQDYPRTSFYAAHRSEIAEFGRAADEGKRWRPPAPTEPATPPGPPGPPERTPAELHAALRAQVPGYSNSAEIQLRDGRIVSVVLPWALGIRNLEFLRGMKLRVLRFNSHDISDLSPLEGMLLEHLSCYNNQVSSLAPLKGMPLVSLECWNDQITDLSPLKGMPLTRLACFQNQITDLSPLSAMPLHELDCSWNPIADLSPLRGLPLQTLNCAKTRVTDLTPLRGLPLQTLNCAETRVTDLAPLAGMRLENLNVHGLPIRDLSILRAMPLRTLTFSPRKVQGDIQSLRDHPTLEQISLDPGDRMPVAIFRKALDVAAGRCSPAELDPLDEPWRKKLDATFAKKISFDFAETPFPDVVASISRLADLTFVLDDRFIKGEPKKITLHVKDMPLREATSLVLQQAGLASVLLDEAVFITTPERARSLPGSAEATRLGEVPPGADGAAVTQILLLRRFGSIDFVEEPLQGAVTPVSWMVDAPIVVDPEWSRGAPKTVTLRVRDMRTCSMFRWVCRLAGATYIWRDGVFFVASPERIREALRQDRDLYAPQPPPKEFEAAMARTTSFDFVEVPLSGAAPWVGQAAELPVAVDQEVAKAKLTFRVVDTRCDRALRWIGRLTGTVPVWRDGKILFTTPERAKRR